MVSDNYKTSMIKVYRTWKEVRSKGEYAVTLVQ